MKHRLPKLLFAIGLAAFGVLPAAIHAREWTSAVDKTRTFEADFVKCENNVVTVRMASGTALSFPLSTVSKADQDFVSKLARKGGSDSDDSKADAPKLNLPKLFEGKLVKVDGDGKVQPFGYEKDAVPDYFVLYVSAYW